MKKHREAPAANRLMSSTRPHGSPAKTQILPRPTYDTKDLCPQQNLDFVSSAVMATELKILRLLLSEQGGG